MTMDTTFVEKQKPYIDEINKTSIKVFIGSGGKDWLIEPWISKEFMSLFHDLKQFETSTTGDEPEITTKVMNEVEKGKKSIGVFFENEGHFLQKFRANLVKEFVLQCLKST